MKNSLLALLFFVPAAFCFSQNSRFSLGARLGGSAPFYKLGSDMYGWDDDDVDPFFSFSGAIQSAVNISDMFAVQAELVFTGDKMSLTGNYYDESFESASMLIPFLAKVSYRPGNFVLSGLAGIYFTVPLGDMKTNTVRSGYNFGEYSYDVEFEKAPLGFMIGANGGIKLGPGSLFADLRYAIDFGGTEVSIYGEVYKRSMLMFSLGYEIEIGKSGSSAGNGGSSSRGGARRR